MCSEYDITSIADLTDSISHKEKPLAKTTLWTTTSQLSDWQQQCSMCTSHSLPCVLKLIILRSIQASCNVVMCALDLNAQTMARVSIK